MSTQEYASYTDEDFEVWRTLFERQMETLRGKVCDEFFAGVEALGLEAGTIPEFESLGDRLEAASGWRVQAVDGQLPGREYWSLISGKRFPSATTLRGRHELSHAKDPDMFHDVFGHLPLLTDAAYSEFLRGMSRIALDHLDEPAMMRRLGRAYKWTIEYGVMRRDGVQRIYGAGLISSSKEIDHVFGDDAKKLPFSVEDAFATKHVPASLQSGYFVTESFEELLESLPAIELALRREREAQATR
jgi:phenylalanine-4-hydroxylase